MAKPTASPADSARATSSAAEAVTLLARALGMMPENLTPQHRAIRALAETILEECDHAEASR